MLGLESTFAFASHSFPAYQPLNAKKQFAIAHARLCVTVAVAHLRCTPPMTHTVPRVLMVMVAVLCTGRCSFLGRYSQPGNPRLLVHHYYTHLNHEDVSCFLQNSLHRQELELTHRGSSKEQIRWKKQKHSLWHTKCIV